MPRRPKLDYSIGMLPPAMEWALGLFFLGTWLSASVGYYLLIFGRMQHFMEVFIPLGVKPDYSAISPILDMALLLAPFAGFPIAIGAWSKTRRLAIRSLLGAF